MAKRTAAILIGLILLVAWLSMGYYKSVTNPVTSTVLTIEIKKGDTFARITQKLIEQQVEINPHWFRLIAVQKNIINKLKAGEYELTPGLTYPQILEMFYEGRAKKYAITFPEGWSLKEILLEIKNYPSLSHSSKLTIPDLVSRLGIADKNPEGWFFPDTYYFDKHATDISILKRAYEKMQSVLKEEWQGRDLDLPYKTPYEALIMASIIEKETGAKSERNRIAGVFIRRLEKSMLLQTDPTVIYGMGDKYQGNIRATDLKTSTAYNTYVISGLPPSPIAMPGREAIYAALHPSKNDSLYFVAKGDGSHHFSASLAEHNEAVNTFQKHKKK